MKPSDPRNRFAPSTSNQEESNEPEFKLPDDVEPDSDEAYALVLEHDKRRFARPAPRIDASPSSEAEVFEEDYERNAQLTAHRRLKTPEEILRERTPSVTSNADRLADLMKRPERKPKPKNEDARGGVRYCDHACGPKRQLPKDHRDHQGKRTLPGELLSHETARAQDACPRCGTRHGHGSKPKQPVARTHGQEDDE